MEPTLVSAEGEVLVRPGSEALLVFFPDGEVLVEDDPDNVVILLVVTLGLLSGEFLRRERHALEDPRVNAGRDHGVDVDMVGHDLSEVRWEHIVLIHEVRAEVPHGLGLTAVLEHPRQR